MNAPTASVFEKARPSQALKTMLVAWVLAVLTFAELGQILPGQWTEGSHLWVFVGTWGPWLASACLGLLGLDALVYWRRAKLVLAPDGVSWQLGQEPIPFAEVSQLMVRNEFGITKVVFVQKESRAWARFLLSSPDRHRTLSLWPFGDKAEQQRIAGLIESHFHSRTAS